jgi:hypothetical protein
VCTNTPSCPPLLPSEGVGVGGLKMALCAYPGPNLLVQTETKKNPASHVQGAFMGLNKDTKGVPAQNPKIPPRRFSPSQNTPPMYSNTSFYWAMRKLRIHRDLVQSNTFMFSPPFKWYTLILAPPHPKLRSSVCHLPFPVSQLLNLSCSALEPKD